MKRYVSTPVKASPDIATPAASTSSSLGTQPDSFNVVIELEKLQEVLRREVRNLMSLSSTGKLMPEHSRDLVNYLKLMNELRKEQEEALNGLTDQELQEIVG